MTAETVATYPGILVGRGRVGWVSAEGAMGYFLTILRETDFLQLGEARGLKSRSVATGVIRSCATAGR